MLRLSGFELYSRWVPLSKCLKGTECLPTNILQSHCRFSGDLFLKLLCKEKREMTIKAFLSVSFTQSVAYC